MKKVFFITCVAIAYFSIETKAQTTPAEKPAVEKTTSVAVDTLVFKPYLGKYKCDMGEIKVWLDGSKLMGELEGQGKGELKVTEKTDNFAIEGMDGGVTFIRNEDKTKVTGVKINAQGQVIEGNKVE
jgi:hypothetical protein